MRSNTIEQIFLKQADRIKSADSQIFEATEVMYETINDRIETLVSKTNYPCKYVVLIGAVFINGDKDMGSFCSYKRFDYIDLTTRKRQSLMDDFYA
jgi:Limiting CO2-inducible proteins B/C beta carbonyic anhydrases